MKSLKPTTSVEFSQEQLFFCLRRFVQSNRFEVAQELNYDPPLLVALASKKKMLTDEEYTSAGDLVNDADEASYSLFDSEQNTPRLIIIKGFYELLQEAVRRWQRLQRLRGHPERSAPSHGLHVTTGSHSGSQRSLPVRKEPAPRQPDPVPATAQKVAKPQAAADAGSANLKTETERLYYSSRCKGCLRNPASHVVLPCSELSICTACLKNSNQCPNCQGPIETTIQTFIPKMDRRTEPLFLSMDEVEVESSEPVESTSPAKVLIMEDVEVASMEEVVLLPSCNHLTMDEVEVASATDSPRQPQQDLSMSEVEVASATDSPRQPQQDLSMSEVEVQSSKVSECPQGPRTKSTRDRNRAEEAMDKGSSEFFENAEQNIPKLTKDEEKVEMGKNFGRNFARSLSRKLSIISAKMDREFSMLHERLDALSGSQQASEELMRPLKLSSIEQYNAFRKQTKFPTFRRKLINALVFNGGMSPEEMGIRCVDFLLEGEFQKEFCWFGRSQKIPFTEGFTDIIKDAVWKRFPNANFASVEHRVQRQLALATEGEQRPSRKRKLCEDARNN